MCVSVCKSDGDSDLPIKVMQERRWSYGTEGRKGGGGVAGGGGGGIDSERRGEEEMRPEKPLNVKSISRKTARESKRWRVKSKGSKILKKDTGRQRGIKKESSDDCDIDDSTVGKTG